MHNFIPALICSITICMDPRVAHVMHIHKYANYPHAFFMSRMPLVAVIVLYKMLQLTQISFHLLICLLVYSSANSTQLNSLAQSTFSYLRGAVTPFGQNKSIFGFYF